MACSVSELNRNSAYDTSLKHLYTAEFRQIGTFLPYEDEHTPFDPARNSSSGNSNLRPIRKSGPSSRYSSSTIEHVTISTTRIENDSEFEILSTASVLSH